jgi:hypothetical protein
MPNDTPPVARAGGAAADGGVDATLRLFEAAVAAEIPLPADAHVIGEPVTVTAIGLPPATRLGLRATCRRGARAHEVSLEDVVFPPRSPAAALVARYRAWLGIDGGAADPAPAPELARPHKVEEGDIAVGRPVELVVLACKASALRCRLLGTAREVTLRTAVRDEIPGAIITVTPTKQWTHARHPYLSGKVSAVRFDAAELGLLPLALRAEGEWDPQDEYWGEVGAPIEAWAQVIIARGKRPMFEMEQVIPGADPDDPDSDPIIEASERNEAGDGEGARELLMKLLAEDLRCLDAHAHLGNHLFDHWPQAALRHYELGVAIGTLSLGDGFEGVLPWGLMDNRPFLRCLHGLGLCAWRLGDRRGAATALERLLWLNPSDEQGARLELAAVRAGKSWQELQGER